MRQRNQSLELLKFLAVIIVANSHMDVLYGKYSALATGGAIGDVLFFFASGFTVFLGRFGRFDNWYKRRIKRVYPSLIAWAGVLSLLSLKQISVSQLVIGGGGYWFVSCIMLYYIALYFVRKWLGEKPITSFVAVGVFVLIWYFFEDSSLLFMYGVTFFKWVHFFLFMLAGAFVGGNVWQLKLKPKWDVLLLVISIVLFYGIQFMAGKSEFFAHLQILSLLPLMGIVVYTYKLCCWDKAKNMMMSKGGVILRFIAGLCLEAYLVQYVIIAQVNGILTSIIPINIILTFILIIIAAYIVRCLARVFSQLFDKEDFDWKAVVRLVD